VFFQKKIYKVKIIDLKKIRLEKDSLKVPTFVRKRFHPKILKCQKVSYQEKKKRESANLSKCTEAPKSITKYFNI
jgi:hypothetical protein